MRGHHSFWNSQPYVNDKPAGNLIVATAIVLAGETFSRIAHLADVINLKLFSKSYFYTIQREIVIPVIDQFYNLQRDTILQQLRGRQLTLGGDGRCDSPGYSAKYCTYTFMDSSGVIPDFSLIQVTETTSSNQMELIGFKRSMATMEEAGLEVGVVVTDRHLQIRRTMTKDHSDKIHQFDVWHLTKSVKKLINNIKPRKLRLTILPWIQSISNHLWWCSRNANGNADLLEESWKSLTFHIINQHTFPGTHVTRCQHPDLEEDVVRKKKWFDPQSAAYKALVKVITDPKLIKDIRQLSLFCHTGSLETYHSMMLKYCAKRQEFDYSSMFARTQLAVIDNNLNIGRNQKTTEEGKPIFSQRCPKSTGRWTARKVYEEKSYTYKVEMVQLALSEDHKHERVVTNHQKRHLQMPKNIARTPAPLMEDLIKSHISRFT